MIAFLESYLCWLDPWCDEGLALGGSGAGSGGIKHVTWSASAVLEKRLPCQRHELGAANGRDRRPLMAGPSCQPPPREHVVLVAALPVAVLRPDLAWWGQRSIHQPSQRLAQGGGAVPLEPAPVREDHAVRPLLQQP